MIVERLIIAGIIIIVGAVAYSLFKQWHLHNIGQLETAVAGTPTILYFQSESCAACPTQSRFLDQLNQVQNGRLTIQKINADQELETANKYRVFTLPTTILMDAKGNVHKINYGLTNTQKLDKQISEIER